MTIIIGAGMAGLLAAAMLRGKATAVWEAQKSLPHNHHSLLRFRSSVVGDVLGIPFRRVEVLKAVSRYSNPVADALSYSFKTNGTYTLRSSISVTGEKEERWIAPSDLVNRMAASIMCPIKYERIWDGSFPPSAAFGDHVISTIPMPTLMDILGWEGRPDFRTAAGISISVNLGEKVDAYVTVYVPDPNEAFSRVSITGSLLIIEYSQAGWTDDVVRRMQDKWTSGFIEGEVLKAFGFLGLSPNILDASQGIAKAQPFAKILPIDDDIRKRFIIWASDVHNVYSLGRFATWRPGLLMDDVVNDVRVIQRLMNGHSRYDNAKRS